MTQLGFHLTPAPRLVGGPDSIVYVVAPSYQRFVSWCRERGLPPGRGDGNVRYVRNRKWVSGLIVREHDEIVDLGGDYDLVQLLETRRRP